MSPLVFTLREAPAQRLDLAPLTPDRLVGLSQSRIAVIQLQTTRDRVLAGDVFKIRMGDPMQTRFEGGSERFDRIGAGMSQGEVSVDGDVGAQAGRFMRGGTLVIAGNAGPWAASGMTDGSLTISGHAGDRLGGPLAGETVGMRGGVVIVRGNAGARAGDRMRRGTIIVRGRAGRLPGYLMNRGTIVTVDGSDALSPTFADSGVHELLATAMMARYVETYSPEVAAMLRRPWRRLLGDMAVIGKGEIFYPSVPD
jgi:formylmethanofuran dehydrogenase subunit C